MIKEDIKTIFLKDKKLALEVAKVLGYKVNIATSDEISKKFSNIIDKILSVKPKFKIKVKNDKSLYQWGDLSNNSLILKINKLGDKFSFAFGIPNIGGSAGGAFLKAGKGSLEYVMKSLESSLKKAKNFLNNRKASIKEDGSIIK